MSEFDWQPIPKDTATNLIKDLVKLDISCDSFRYFGEANGRPPKVKLHVKNNWFFYNFTLDN